MVTTAPEPTDVTVTVPPTTAPSTQSDNTTTTTKTTAAQSTTPATTTVTTVTVETTVPSNTTTHAVSTARNEDTGSSVVGPVVGGVVGGVVVVAIIVIAIILYRRRKPTPSKKTPLPPHPDYVDQVVRDMQNASGQQPANPTDIEDKSVYQNVNETSDAISFAEPEVDTDGYLKKKSKPKARSSSKKADGHIYGNQNAGFAASDGDNKRGATVGAVKQKHMLGNTHIYGNDDINQPVAHNFISDRNEDSHTYGNEDSLRTDNDNVQRDARDAPPYYNSQNMEPTQPGDDDVDETEEYVDTDALTPPTHANLSGGTETHVTGTAADEHASDDTASPVGYVNLLGSKKGEAVFGIKPRTKTSINQTSHTPAVPETMNEPNDYYANTEHTEPTEDDEYELVEPPRHKTNCITAQPKYANL